MHEKKILHSSQKNGTYQTKPNNAYQEWKTKEFKKKLVNKTDCFMKSNSFFRFFHAVKNTCEKRPNCRLTYQAGLDYWKGGGLYLQVARSKENYVIEMPKKSPVWIPVEMKLETKMVVKLGDIFPRQHILRDNNKKREIRKCLFLAISIHVVLF